MIGHWIFSRFRASGWFSPSSRCVRMRWHLSHRSVGRNGFCCRANGNYQLLSNAIKSHKIWVPIVSSFHQHRSGILLLTVNVSRFSNWKWLYCDGLIICIAHRLTMESKWSSIYLHKLPTVFRGTQLLSSRAEWAGGSNTVLFVVCWAGW